jgi:hypothetical protein
MRHYQHVEKETMDLLKRIKWNFKVEGTPECCPHCGGETFYRKVRFSGRSHYNYQFDALTAENGSLHDGCDYRMLKSVYCENCERKLGTVQKESV